MESIAVPAWLAQAVAVGIGGQFVLLVGWLIRQDKNRALAEKDAEAKRALGEAEIKTRSSGRSWWSRHRKYRHHRCV